ncbi:MAG: hypothetical protein ABI960_05545 [Candidatus Eisenbacteria bacterium]
MPYDYKIDPGARRVFVRAFGPSTFDEARRSAQTLIVDARYQPTFAILVDGRELEYLASYEDALQFRDMFGLLKESFRGPIAVVVQGTARYGVSRMVATLADLAGVRMEAFLTVADAEAWLIAQAGG